MSASNKKLFILFAGEMRFFHENILSINESLNEYDKTFLFYPCIMIVNANKIFFKCTTNLSTILGINI